VKAKQDKQPDESVTEATPVPRRRIGRVVRDERDSAIVEWVDAPADYRRVPLAIESTLPPGGVKAASGYDPYETLSPHRAAGSQAGDKRPARRDLRKLSEWIKQMRTLEERRKRGED
jgi:hypothetical protein